MRCRARGIRIAVLGLAVGFQGFGLQILGFESLGFQNVASAQTSTEVTIPETPDVPELIIPEELRVEADRLDAEEDAARAARESGEDEAADELIDQTPLPRFDTPARRLSDLNRDERSIERLRVDCRSDLGRRDITLFANGTVRLRQGPWHQQDMQLEELGPEELTVYLKRLMRIRRSDEFPRPDPSNRFALDGQWLTACRLTVETPGDRAISLSFNPLETQVLPIGQVVSLAEELAGFTRPAAKPNRLLSGYEPQIDDLLRGRDGALYRVISPTDDGKAVELESLIEPLTIYHAIADLPQLFSRVVTTDPYGEERIFAEPDVLELEDRDLGFSAWGRVVEPWDAGSSSSGSSPAEDPSLEDPSWEDPSWEDLPSEDLSDLERDPVGGGAESP